MHNYSDENEMKIYFHVKSSLYRIYSIEHRPRSNVADAWKQNYQWTSPLNKSSIGRNQLINESQGKKIENLNFRALRYPTTCLAIERRSVTSRFHGVLFLDDNKTNDDDDRKDNGKK